MKFGKRRRDLRALEDEVLDAQHPGLEPGTAVLVNGVPPGLEKFEVDWVAVPAEVIWIEDVSGTTSGVTILVQGEDCPLKLQPGYDKIELIVEPETLTVV